MASKWENNVKAFLDNYKTACECYGTDSLTWIAYGIPSKKQIYAVFFLPKSNLESEASKLSTLLPAPVELLGAEDAVVNVSKFAGLKFAWSLLKNITAQKLAQRLTTVKHVDSLSTPVGDFLVRTKLSFLLSACKEKTALESVKCVVDAVKKELDHVEFVHVGSSHVLNAKGNLLKSLMKDQKKEPIAIKVVELVIKKDDVEDITFKLNETGVEDNTHYECVWDVLLRLNKDCSDADLTNRLKSQIGRLLDQAENCVKMTGVVELLSLDHINIPGMPVTVSIVHPQSSDFIKHISKLFNHPIADFGPTKYLKLMSGPQRNGLLTNPHEFLKVNPIGQVAIVQGGYDYHHYMQDGFDDAGWGCAYRSFQTVWSWLREQGHTDKPVPTHNQIQQCLVDIGDKQPSFVGSKQWIGSMELSFCLSTLLQIESKVLTTNSGSELPEHARTLIYHFENHGGPVMIGGGQLAHTIIGVDYNTKTAECRYLVLDPHYTGDETLNTVLNGGWCGWKSGDFWAKSSFYNLLLPQTKSETE